MYGRGGASLLNLQNRDLPGPYESAVLRSSYSIELWRVGPVTDPAPVDPSTNKEWRIGTTFRMLYD